jgi:hypothetical protein
VYWKAEAELKTTYKHGEGEERPPFTETVKREFYVCESGDGWTILWDLPSKFIRDSNNMRI